MKKKLRAELRRKMVIKNKSEIIYGVKMYETFL